MAEYAHEWTYDDGTVSTFGSVRGFEKEDCRERVIMVLEAEYDHTIDSDALEFDWDEEALNVDWEI